MVKVKFVNKELVILPKGTREGDYHDGKLLQVLFRMQERQEKNFDNVILLVGDVGTGKTTLGFSMLNFMLNGNISIVNVGVGAEDCMKKISELPDKSGIILDDASSIFYGSDHASKHQKKAIKVLHLCRSKNLTIILTTPDLFKLNNYLVTQRVRCVIKVYTTANLERGRFAFWGYKKVKSLYFLGKKYNNTYPRKIRADFLGRFTDFKPSFNKKYEELKRKAMESLFEEKPKEFLFKELKPIYINMLKRLEKMEKPIQYKQFGQLTGLSNTSITTYRQEIAQEHKETNKSQVPI